MHKNAVLYLELKHAARQVRMNDLPLLQLLLFFPCVVIPQKLVEIPLIPDLTTFQYSWKFSFYLRGWALLQIAFSF